MPNSEQTIALDQVICPVTDFKLGSMGVPPKVMVNGEPVFICCEGCREGLLQEPDMYLAKLQDYRTKGRAAADVSSESFEVPEIGEMVPIDDEAVPEIGPIEMIDSDDAEIPKVHMTFDGLEGGRDQ